MAGPKFSKKQKAALSELEKLARRLGLRISYGRLRFAGLKLKSGQCLFRGEKWLVMDRKQPFEDQLEVFKDALSQFDLKGTDLSPEVTRLLGLDRLDAQAGAGEA